MHVEGEVVVLYFGQAVIFPLKAKQQRVSLGRRGPEQASQLQLRDLGRVRVPPNLVVSGTLFRFVHLQGS